MNTQIKPFDRVKWQNALTARPLTFDWRQHTQFSCIQIVDSSPSIPEENANVSCAMPTAMFSSEMFGKSFFFSHQRVWARHSYMTCETYSSRDEQGYSYTPFLITNWNKLQKYQLLYLLKWDKFSDHCIAFSRFQLSSWIGTTFFLLSSSTLSILGQS